MNDGSTSVPVRRLKVVLLVSSLVSLVLLLLAAFEENLAGEWREHQVSYRDTLVTQASSDAARQAAQGMEIAFQQAFLPDLGRVDRCVSCHVTGHDQATGFESASMKPDLSSVQCDACHNMGTLHEPVGRPVVFPKPPPYSMV